LKREKFRYVSVGISLLLIFCFVACGPSGDESKKIKAASSEEASKPPVIPEGQKADMAAAVPGSAGSTTAVPGKSPAKTLPADIVVQVDGARLTRGQLDGELKKNLTALSGKIPTDRLAEASAKIRRQIVDDFIVRTLLGKEANAQKIEATDKEINEAINNLKSTLPSGMTMEEMMKKNAITSEKLREDVSLGIRINKLVAKQAAGKEKPTDKEINQFYKANPDKFKLPEAVHARHILLAKAKDADDAAKAKQKAKAEDLRKQLLGGADFAELARTNSDCPSKTNGGDLGQFSRGQMVKPFEDAAFSQKKNDIGPVVETDFGYHIIQVLDHSQPKTQSLDKNTKTQISAFLQQQKRYAAFNEVMNQLKAKADIQVADKID